MTLGILAAAGMLALGACSSEEATDVATLQQTATGTHTSADARVPFKVYAPQAGTSLSSEQLTAMQRLNGFGLRLFNSIREDGRSQVFSPLSLDYALGMVALGADGVPLHELNAMLGFDADDRTTLHDLCATLMQNLPAQDPDVSLNVANAFYLNEALSNVQLNPDYRQALNASYQADCEALDFGLKESVDYVNNWCSRQTNGFITQVLDNMNEDALAYLLNALYFKADWTYTFPTDYTHEADFHREDGQVTKVQMMCQAISMNFPYEEDETAQVLCLPYARGRYFMTVLLPKEGQTVDDVLANLTEAHLAELVELPAQESYDPYVVVQLPRFEAEVTTHLNEPLETAGIPSWFDENGRLHGIGQYLDGMPIDVYVSKIFQKARIRVHEKGTEAAAVTVGEIEATGMRQTVDFTANHPFVYFISERSSRAILFVGTYHGDDVQGVAGQGTGIRDIRMD